MYSYGSRYHNGALFMYIGCMRMYLSLSSSGDMYRYSTMYGTLGKALCTLVSCVCTCINKGVLVPYTS